MPINLTASADRFESVFARNCSVRRIDRTTAAAFFARYHSLGDTRGRYCYGIFVERGVRKGQLVAAGMFSPARRWVRDGREIRSYEWVRYASVTDMRVVGGMGKVLAAFVREVAPDDVMSYADASWSEGDAYVKLGFVPEEPKVFPDGNVSLKFRKVFTSCDP